MSDGQQNHAAIFEFTKAAGWTCIGGYVFVTDKGVLVELRPFSEKWHICLIVTPRQERQKGHARAAMRVVLKAADDHGVTLSLNAVPTRGSGMRQPQLIKWYARYGFIKQSTSPEMNRPPKREKTNQHTTKS
jgi:GNAT superfamily N-acetyltransferase